MFSIADNIKNVRNRIEKATIDAAREPGSISLLAVSKTRSPDELLAAARCGLVEFGENYLQEALDKIEALKAQALIWHFIGPIQSNKTRPIAENFAWVHTVDRLKIAERLSAQRPAQLPPLNICIQINIDNEASKSGIALSELLPLAEQIKPLPQIKIRGLMAIPSAEASEEALHNSYQQMRDGLKQLQTIVPDADTLSMGMSDDLEIAIEEGATIIRIGTALFGPRAYPNKG